MIIKENKINNWVESYIATYRLRGHVNRRHPLLHDVQRRTEESVELMQWGLKDLHSRESKLHSCGQGPLAQG